MRKRVLSIILCLCMMFMLLPVAASAETVTGEGTQAYISPDLTSSGNAAVDKVIDDYIAANINASMTLYEKLEAMCKFVCSYDYSAYYSSASGMILNGGGDCWASTDTILIMCEKLGINANARNGNKDPGAGSGHMNVFVTESAGSYYEVEAGYNGTAPRHYNITKRNSPFSFSSVSGGIMIYQYDGDPTAITKLEIPSTINGNTVVAIGDSFLNLNKTITEIVIPNTVTSLGKSAFNSCSALKTLNILASVTSIGEFAFTACNALVNFTCDSGNPAFTIENGVLYNKEKTTLISAPSCSSLVIPSTVTTIGTYSFYYNMKLTSVTIPDSVTTVEEGAFGDCTALESVTIPGSITKLENSAFRNTTNLKKVTFEGDGALTVDADAFTGVPSDCKYYKMSESKSITGSGADKITMTSEDEAATHKITVATASNGEISANVSTAAKGATVTVTAKPKDGYALKSLTVKTVSGSSVTVSSSNTFTMPEEDVTVTAEFMTKTLQYETDYVAEKKRLLELINAERAKQGVAPLTMNNTLLQAAADIRETEVAELFSHTRPNGTDCFTAIEEQGLTGYAMGENIAMNFSGVDAAVTQWMNSDGHRANILNASFTQTAFGVAKSGGEWYFVQMFFTGDNPKPGEIVEKGEASEKFSDVKSGDWYYDSVKYVQEKGLMVGTSDTTFEPNTTTNRGMIVTILYRLEGEPSVAGLSNFPDVPSGAWYANAVAWAKDKGVTYGDENGRFGATDDLTREQLATMFYRYAKMNGKADESDADLTFKDNAEISDWAEAAIKWCVANGIVSGKGNNILDPQGKATRAEMATIIQRFVEKVS